MDSYGLCTIYIIDPGKKVETNMTNLINGLEVIITEDLGLQQGNSSL